MRGSINWRAISLIRTVIGRRRVTVVTIYELSQALGVNYIELLKPDVQAKRE